jgi:hypothetical protein
VGYSGAHRVDERGVLELAAELMQRLAELPTE